MLFKPVDDCEASVGRLSLIPLFTLLPLASSSTSSSEYCQENDAKMMSKPIPITNNPLREQQRNYTAPADVPLAFQPQPQRLQCKPVVYRVGPSGSTVVSAGQRPSMAYAAYEDNDCDAVINAQQLNAYRERVLQEALRRMNVLNCREQDNKENSANTPASSNQARHTLSERTFGNDVNEFVTSGTSGSNANCDQDSDEERRSGSVCSTTFTDFWDDSEEEEDELMPPSFNSIGDIIGYSKVVRAQRDEAMSKLSTVLTEFDHTVSRLRKEFEERRARQGTTSATTTTQN